MDGARTCALGAGYIQCIIIPSLIFSKWSLSSPIPFVPRYGNDKILLGDFLTEESFNLNSIFMCFTS